MYIRVISDIHLEIDDAFYAFNETNEADILVIAGDFTVANYFTRSEASPYSRTVDMTKYFLERASRDYEHVLYTPGNHEHYQGYFDLTDSILENVCSEFENVHYLQNKSIVLGDTKFIGGTMWTNFYNANPVAMQTVKHGMNDYRIIQWKKNYQKLRPDDTLAEFVNTREFIYKELIGCDKAVVITHHAPCFKSVADVFKDDYYMNAGYYSNLEDFILDNQQIRLWCHGHMHNSSDYHIATSRVVCNPRGYRNENSCFDPYMRIKI